MGSSIRFEYKADHSVSAPAHAGPPKTDGVAGLTSADLGIKNN
jgi:hypothetical protein